MHPEAVDNGGTGFIHSNNLDPCTFAPEFDDSLIKS